MADTSRIPCIYVLAGTNGAGKSSVAGAMIRQSGADYFSGMTEANGAAWHEGKRLLERAIGERCDFAFETTLGGSTITTLLQRALASGVEVRVWYVGLSSPALHIARVRARVRKGGHQIPEAAIRDRYDRSRLNLIQLLPKLTELRVYDNSVEADPHTGAVPQLKLVLHMVRGKVASSCNLALTPEWAKPILAAAMGLGPRL